MGPKSSYDSLLLSHFCHTSLPYFAFNSAVLWTLGNYHVLKYGTRHFAALYGASCLIGGVLTAANLVSNENAFLAGGICGSSGLIAYNVFRNAARFKFGLPALPFLEPSSFVGPTLPTPQL